MRPPRCSIPQHFTTPRNIRRRIAGHLFLSFGMARRFSSSIPGALPRINRSEFTVARKLSGIWLRWRPPKTEFSISMRRWRKDPRKSQVTIRQLLDFSAGLAPGFGLQVNEYGDRDQAALRLPMVAKP